MSRKPIRLYHTDRYALSACQKSKNEKKGTKYCSVLGNQQNWFAKYINKKAYSTFSQPIGKLFDVVFSRTTIHAKLQNLMSSTFKYSFTNAQDFCARKGNKISLSYHWKISIYAWLEVLINMRLKYFCNLYQGSSLPISTYTYDRARNCDWYGRQCD